MANTGQCIEAAPTGEAPRNDGISLQTAYVKDDESCFAYAEVNRVTLRSGAGVRRIQIIQVVRDDRLWEFRRDMGPAEMFKTEPFCFQGAVAMAGGRWDVLETVGRLRDAAENFRAIQDRPAQRRDPLDMVEGFYQTATRRWEAKTGRKQFAMSGGKA